MHSVTGRIWINALKPRLFVETYILSVVGHGHSTSLQLVSDTTIISNSSSFKTVVCLGFADETFLLLFQYNQATASSGEPPQMTPLPGALPPGGDFVPPPHSTESEPMSTSTPVATSSSDTSSDQTKVPPHHSQPQAQTSVASMGPPTLSTETTMQLTPPLISRLPGQPPAAAAATMVEPCGVVTAQKRYSLPLRQAPPLMEHIGGKGKQTHDAPPIAFTDFDSLSFYRLLPVAHYICGLINK